MKNLRRAAQLIQDLKVFGVIQEGDYCHIYFEDTGVFSIEVESNQRNGWGKTIKRAIEEEFSDKEVTIKRTSTFNVSRSHWKDGFCFEIREAAHN